ncbi:hypothetical protein J2X63_003407 [Agromyces sp. 3263]|uniref:septum formation family protein n=1 Tax=Agromyces sp. 3263 TaxID=2817750 RepID=UPI002855F54C|nr:septum formation family protein [Agromyces sp. 3263]MDR6907699.1 hypothetical protein [Agromyces sp. 3263]
MSGDRRRPARPTRNRRGALGGAAATCAALALVLTACAPASEQTGWTDAATARPTASPAPPDGAAASQSASPGAAAGAPVAAPRYLPAVGECLDARKDAAAGPESVVPCSEPHDDEVYAGFELPPGDPPGPAGQQQADDGCLARFDDFIGIPAADSMLGWYSFAPRESDWAAGDRRVACAVWHPTDLVTGSLEGVAY